MTAAEFFYYSAGVGIWIGIGLAAGMAYGGWKMMNTINEAIEKAGEGAKRVPLAGLAWTIASKIFRGKGGEN